MRRFMLLAALCAVLVLALTPAVMAQTTDLYDCGDFRFQEDAQDVYNQDTSDPYGLDEDDGADDGIACETLPSRGDTTGGGVAPVPGSAECPNVRITSDGRQCSDLPDAIPGDTGTQYAQPVSETPDTRLEGDGTDAQSETPVVTTTTTALPATGGLPLAPLAGASLLVLGVAGLVVRRRVS